MRCEADLPEISTYGARVPTKNQPVSLVFGASICLMATGLPCTHGRAVLTAGVHGHRYMLSISGVGPVRRWVPWPVWARWPALIAAGGQIGNQTDEMIAAFALRRGRLRL